MVERVQKILSNNGYCSRRAAEKLISEGRVKVNGRKITLGDGADISKDHISVDNKTLSLSSNPIKLYYMLNKPRGYVTTLKDQFERKDITSLISDIEERVFPVGRLDMNSEGLLLLTNDGDFANLVSHPTGGVTKTYRVSVKPTANEEQISKLTEGTDIEGVKVVPTSLYITGEDKEKTVFDITIKEGKNREIRRMCEEVGLNVTRLKRTAIGQLKLGTLRSGQYRELTKQELNLILTGTGKKVKL